MQISNNTSPSFGSIQVGVSRMTANQRRISNRLFNTIKYTDKYSKIGNGNVDIYMLPRKSGGIEIRFMDPFSGSFVRDNNNKIIKENLYGSVTNKVEEVADKVINIYEQIVNGTILRPKQNIEKVIDGKTEMVRINPDKEHDFSEAIKEYREIGFSEEGAKEQAFEQYKSLYHIDNKDANF